MLKVVLKNYDSPFFPVMGAWTINDIRFNAVFENVEQARNYFIGRYIHVSFIDRRAA